MSRACPFIIGRGKKSLLVDTNILLEIGVKVSVLKQSYIPNYVLQYGYWILLNLFTISHICISVALKVLRNYLHTLHIKKIIFCSDFSNINHIHISAYS